jgi:GT2 family glycosyltransferase
VSRLAEPRATIVVAAHSDAARLQATVTSALEQTEPSIEVIVAGTPGATLHALEDVADPRLVTVGCAGGTPGALNAGIALARGALVVLLADDGACLDPASVARSAAAFDGFPTCALALPAPPSLTLDPASRPCPSAAHPLLAGLLRGDVPYLGSALFRTGALRGVGGLDATLRSAYALDLFLRLLPGRNVLLLHDGDVRRAPGAATDDDDPRAELAFVLVRALCDHGLDWWGEVLAAANGTARDATAGGDLAALLARSDLPELAPLARAAARGADASARVLIDAAIARGVARGSGSADASPDGTARRQVHEVAALLRRGAGQRRALHDGNRRLAATAPWLASELDATRRSSEEALGTTARILDKLRLRQRVTSYAQRVRSLTRGAAPGTAASSDAARAAIAPGPRRERWLILAAVPVDDIGGGQRSAQLARALVASGARVTYVARFPRAESIDLAIHSDLPGLEVVGWDPAELRRWLDARDEQLRVLVEIPEPEVVALAATSRARGARVVYDKIDNWAACAWAQWYDPTAERAMIMHADDLVGSARLLVRQLARDGRTALLVPNAVDTGLFSPPDGAPLPAPPDLVRGDVTLVYAGSLWGDWFDWRLVAEVAALRPRWSVNLIGDRPARIPGDQPANVHLLGLKPQSSLPGYLAAADACLIPFVPSPLVDAVSPLKAFEYLAMHRPVVATPMPELTGMPYVFTALAGDATVAAIEQAVATPPPVTELEDFRAHNGWRARVDTLRALVARPTISVIVLCYDNRDVIEDCVASLLRARGDARYQVIVVDNGSSDGSLEILERHAARGDVVLHRNLVNGCSSGRNLGVRLSASEIVVFLDSDQRALHPGWLEPALAILRDHAEVGAVGWSGGWFAARGARGTTVEQLADRGATGLGRAGFRTDIAYLATSGLVVPRAVLQRTQGFDEHLDPTCFEDTDLSFQIKDAGYELAFCPALGLDHRPHATTGALASYGDVYRRNERYFLAKWRARPAYFRPASR